LPKIPVYSNSVGIDVKAIPEMGTGAISKSAATAKGVTEEIANAESLMVKVRDFRQQTEAQNYTFEQLNAVKSAADQDTEFDASKYEDAIDRVGEEAGKTISGALARDEFHANFQRQATAVKWGIKNQFRDRELKSVDASIDYQGQQIADNYGGMNEADRITNVFNFRQSLENAVKIGLYNQGTADAKYAEFQKKVYKGQVEYDIYNDPATQEDKSDVLRALKNTKDETYSFLDSDTRLDMIKASQQRIFQNNQTFKRQTEEETFTNRADGIEKVLSGEINQTNFAQNRDKIAAVDPDLAGAMQNVFSNRGRYEARESNVDFQDLAEAMLKSENKKALSDFIIKAAKNPKVNQDQLSVLVDVARERAKDIGNHKTSNIPGFINAAVDFITATLPPAGVGLVLLKTLQRFKTEKPQGEQMLNVAKDEVRKQRLQDNPNIVNAPKTGKRQYNPKLNQYRISYPDGTVEYENAKQ